MYVGSSDKMQFKIVYSPKVKKSQQPFNLRIGKTVSVLYTLETLGKPDRLKWFHGTITNLRKYTSDYIRVNILFDNGELVKGFDLHFDLYRKRREAAWR